MKIGRLEINLTLHKKKASSAELRISEIETYMQNFIDDDVRLQKNISSNVIAISKLNTKIEGFRNTFIQADLEQEKRFQQIEKAMKLQTEIISKLTNGD